MSKLHYRCEKQKRKVRFNIGIIKRKTEQNETTSNYSTCIYKNKRTSIKNESPFIRFFLTFLFCSSEEPQTGFRYRSSNDRQSRARNDETLPGLALLLSSTFPRNLFLPSHFEGLRNNSSPHPGVTVCPTLSDFAKASSNRLFKSLQVRLALCWRFRGVNGERGQELELWEPLSEFVLFTDSDGLRRYLSNFGPLLEAQFLTEVSLVDSL